MNRVLAVLTLSSLTLVLASCYSAGKRAGEGAFDAAREYFNSPEADRLIDAKVAKGVEAGKAVIRKEYKEEVETARKAVEDGTAEWWQILLLAAAGYPVMRGLRQKVFGPAAPPPSA